MNKREEYEEKSNIIRKAFEMGMNWAEAYQGWFIPTDEQTEEKVQEAIAELL